MRTALRQTAIPILALCGIAESLLFLLQKLHVLECWHCTVPSGTFQNPGSFGGFIACCLMALFGLAKGLSTKRVRIALYSVSTILITALGLSCSRAACAAVIVGCTVLYAGRLIDLRKSVPVIAAILVSFGLLYFIRPASANGRLLVWRVCLGMIAERPITGHGLFAMRRKYMLYQADYFSNHPDSAFSEFADNTIHCFNEPIHICVCFGVAGLLLASLVVAPALASKSKDPGNHVIKSILCTWLTFSLFSYPLSVFRLSALVPICLLAADSAIDARRSLRIIYDCIILAILFVIMLWNISGTWIERRIVNTNAEMRWSTELLEFFPEQYDLYVSMRYERGSKGCDSLVLSACEHIPSYGLYLKAGDVCLEQGKDSLALSYYNTASLMIPLRLLPHYKMFQYYWENDGMQTAVEIGEHILQMPLKVKSSLSFQITGDVKRKLSQLD